MRELETLVPPAGEVEPSLVAAIAAHTTRRALAVASRLPAGRARLLREAVTDSRFAAAGPVRCWLHAFEEVSALMTLWQRHGPNARTAMVERVHAMGALAELAPHGSLPADFRERVCLFATRRFHVLADDLPLLALPALPRHARSGWYAIEPTADTDSGRTARRLHVPGTTIEIPARRPVLKVKLLPTHWTADRLRHPYPQDEGAPYPQLTVGNVLRDRGLRSAVGARDAGFVGRVRRALDLLDRVWPDAAALVRRQTHRVVPVPDQNVVSFSGASRPGISYIHQASRPAMRLAEDLLHEATHQRVHDLEVVHRLVGSAPGSEEGPRFWSPWRREWRPLRGLLHGACTFSVGAELFARMLDSAEPFPQPRRLWLARRLLEEVASVRTAMRVLEGAAADGLLEPAGTALLTTVQVRLPLLSSRSRAARSFLRTSGAGRAELARAESHVQGLRHGSLRWGW